MFFFFSLLIFFFIFFFLSFFPLFVYLAFYFPGLLIKLDEASKSQSCSRSGLLSRHWSDRVFPELVCHFKPKYGWGQELGSAGLPVLQGSLDIVTVQRVLTLKPSEFWAGVCLSCP